MSSLCVFFYITYIKSDSVTVETTELTPNTPKNQSGSRNNINAEQLVANGNGDVCAWVCAGIICHWAGHGIIFSSHSDCFWALLLQCPTLPVYFGGEWLFLLLSSSSAFLAGSPSKSESTHHTLKSHFTERRGGVLTLFCFHLLLLFAPRTILHPYPPSCPFFSFPYFCTPVLLHYSSCLSSFIFNDIFMCVYIYNLFYICMTTLYLLKLKCKLFIYYEKDFNLNINHLLLLLLHNCETVK